jgi:hypothetical protein
LELADRLRSRGHEIFVLGPAKLEPDVAVIGFSFAAIPDYPLGGPPVKRIKGAAARDTRQRRARQAAGVEALDVGPLASVLKSFGPNLVLIDFEMHAHIMTCVAEGYPVALFTGIIAGLPGLQAPPLHLGIVPGEGFGGSRAGVGLAWLRFWIWKHRKRLAEKRRFGGGDYDSLLQAYARARGFDFAGEITRWRWQIPFSYKKIPLLLFHARAFDLPSPRSPLISYVGPMLGEPPEGSAQSTGRAAEVLSKLAEVRERHGGKLIYIAFGTIAAPPPEFLTSLWEVVSRNPDWLFVLAEGGRPLGLEKDLPANLLRFAWVPQHQALRFAAAAIIHAGQNSIVECIDRGVPILAFPFPVNDQMGNAARLRYHGLGVIGKMTDQPEEIEQALRQAMSDPKISESIARMRGVFHRYRSEGRAEQTVEALLSAPNGPS